MDANQIKARIESFAPNTVAKVYDLTGTQDHWEVIVVSPAFEGKKMLEQHKMVYDLFQNEIQTNEVHALTIKTYTPQAYKKLKS
jgi:stress-induced morphogen